MSRSSALTTLLITSLLVAPAVRAQVHIYENRVERAASPVAGAIGGENAAFGARINIATGSTSFSVPVLSIPGDNGLDIVVAYKLGIRDLGGTYSWDFEEDEPYLSGSFSEEAGWTTTFGGSARCSNVNNTGYGPPNVPSSNGRPGFYYTEDYWSGYFLTHRSGGGRLNRFSQGYSSPNPPTDGSAYYWATNDFWYFSCIPLVAGTGEGFLGRSPDGLKYHFNTMREGLWIPDLWKYNDAGQDLELSRKEIRLYAGKIEDRHGNWVAGLTASDGRSVSRNVSGSTVTYSYGSRQWVVNTANPFSVTYPDGSTWSATLGGSITSYPGSSTCPDISTWTASPSSFTATIKAPSGATAVYTLKQVGLGYSYVSGQCVPLDDGSNAVDRPSALVSLAMTKRTVSGPGMPSQTVDVTYGSSNECYSNPMYWHPQCTGSSPTTRTVTYSYSDGRYTRYIVGNRDFVNADLLLKEEEGFGSSAPLRTTEYEYSLQPDVGSFVGIQPYSVEAFMRPVLIRRKTTQDGRVFDWRVSSTCGGGASLCLDSYGRPTKVVRSSSP